MGPDRLCPAMTVCDLVWGGYLSILWVKYLNNIVEQDHYFMKKSTRPMKGFKAFHSAVAACKASKSPA